MLARFSYYSKALSLLTGRERPTFEYVRQENTSYIVGTNRFELKVDMVTSRVTRVAGGDMSAGDIDNMIVPMELANIRSLPTPVAASRVAAALRIP